MTRDEARPFVKQMLTILDADDAHPDSKAEMLISAFRNLGMLPIDEPKSSASFANRIDASIKTMGWAGGMSPVLNFCGLNIEQAIRHAGLKIVEK